jgi:hypothetical protein
MIYFFFLDLFLPKSSPEDDDHSLMKMLVLYKNKKIHLQSNFQEG